ncbi:ATP-binding protein [Umezakia ovalisporum]|uniref:Cyanophycin synthetase n=2 Tax=Umezakia ovalisporum TaxID=75695 RepID=A0AA43KDT0_9CYAN|nr:cyanophycin synthetase [Umezakia ovalisporum]MDH6056739.1 cyanophycin synthetase [Umezakia ovalisporum FSS-43]MDH6062670.1 cyanophycin synthetase [Umezakia ovalisporum FSS-62]MDH6067822.1 cyanophycin synthetase [Umezakia ovalisporum APH033B]MDH6072154.1 cyanophycin synthetase [Umezakia ovalisporum CobakiLakeA]MDH6075272.1 cyanophycin synthetase [Umezakia ovalisporum CS-1034]
MVQHKTRGLVPINARKTDVFDIFNFKHYIGPNPYLDTGALVFDFALIESTQPLSIEDYLSSIGRRYAHLAEQIYESYPHLFARVASEVGKLDMGLHLNRWSIKPYADYTRISIQSLHEPTTRAVVYFVWDWLEAITQNKKFFFDEELLAIQKKFRQSVYGGPTVYALLRTAYEKGIPTFYLWSEALMQYGYGKKQVRGVATTFDCDSHLDSDFTTRKDECKTFMQTLGLPIPEGDIVCYQKEALEVAKEIGYPVAVKPVVGHKGIGVTAEVGNSRELESAYDSALAAIPQDQSPRIIVEKSISGTDFRLLCVNGKFVAATERRPPSVTGDGCSNIAELIREENRQPARLDTPTSPMSKIQCDHAMELYLKEQGLSLDSVVKKGRTVYLRKVANLSAGGISIDATSTIHHDNIILAQDIAQHFRLTCLGIDVIAENLSESWKSSNNFAILEINAAPGILMHLNPAVGESVDVPSRILETFFPSSENSRIPIITFNKISVEELQMIINCLLLQHPDWTIGAVCQDAVFVNHSRKPLHRGYNTNVETLLRNPKLDLLITEYDEFIIEEEGMFYQGSNIVVLNNPTETEMMLARNVFDDSTVVIKKEKDISIRRGGLIEDYTLAENESFTKVYFKVMGTI